jgi:2-dehydro-3-deoxygluconokinase
MKRQFVAIGEAMLELSQQGTELNDIYKLKYAGDTLNVCYYLSKYADALNLDIHYATALGSDQYSREMCAQWLDDGIKTDFVLQIPNAKPGLYVINIDPNGERTFYYYRESSAAKQLFNERDFSAQLDKLRDFKYIYFSGISLAILDSISQQKLLKLIEGAKKRGATIIFDPNYRPTLWQNTNSARNVIDQALSLTNIAMPTFVDEALLYDDSCPQDTIARLQEKKIKEIIVKNGDRGCIISYGGKNFEIPCVAAKVIDTTAAGDSFNAGYLAARLDNKSPEKAAEYAHKVAAKVIGQHGALISKDDLPEL